MHAAKRPKGTPLDDYARQWVARRRTEGLRSAKAYDSIVRCHFGGLTIETLRRTDCLRLAASLADRGLAPRSRRNVLQLMRRVMSEAVEDGLIVKNPVPKQRGLDVDKDPRWRDAARYTMADAARLSRLRPIWRVLFLTGLRVSELSALMAGAYVATETPLPALYVVASYNTRERKRQGTKSGRDRRVPVPPQLQHTIEDLIAASGNGLLVQVRSSKGVGPLRNDTANHWLKADCARLRIPYRGVHAIRATYISALIESGADPHLVERITHNRPSGGAGGRVLAGYTRGLEWGLLCETASRLKLPEALPEEQLGFRF